MLHDSHALAAALRTAAILTPAVHGRPSVRRFGGSKQGKRCRISSRKDLARGCARSPSQAGMLHSCSLLASLLDDLRRQVRHSGYIQAEAAICYAWCQPASIHHSSRDATQRRLHTHAAQPMGGVPVKKGNLRDSSAFRQLGAGASAG